MRTRVTNRNRAFTLIEILIVVVILGILAAIVIPQFTDASDDAGRTSVQSQLQTVRSQIELYRVQNGGTLPDFVNNDWDDLVDGDYLQQAPRNPLVSNSTLIGNGANGPGQAAGAGNGWYWNTTDDDMFGVDDSGLIMDW
jgi:type II secretion system protein G